MKKLTNIKIIDKSNKALNDKVSSDTPVNSLKLTNKEKKRVLIITAHADDHIAAAGTLFKLKARGFELFEVVLTSSNEGGDYRGKNGNTPITEFRNGELSEASKYLGMTETFCLNQDDLGLMYSKELMLKVAGIIRQLQPGIGIITNSNDWHTDHVAANKIGSEAFKWAGTGIRPEMGESWRTPVVLCAEGMIPIQPNILVDITGYEEKKAGLWKIYKSQASPKALKFDESLTAIRGYQLRKVNSFSAEAFSTDPSSPVILLDGISE